MKIKVLSLAYLRNESPGKEIILFFLIFIMLCFGFKLCFKYGYFLEYERFLEDLTDIHLLVSTVVMLIINFIDRKIGEIVFSEDIITIDMYDYETEQIPNTELDVIQLQWQGGRTYKIWIKGNAYTTKLKDRDLQLFYDHIDKNKLNLKTIRREFKSINLIKKYLTKYKTP